VTKTQGKITSQKTGYKSHLQVTVSDSFTLCSSVMLSMA